MPLHPYVPGTWSSKQYDILRPPPHPLSAKFATTNSRSRFRHIPGDIWRHALCTSVFNDLACTAGCTSAGGVPASALPGFPRPTTWKRFTRLDHAGLSGVLFYEIRSLHDHEFPGSASPQVVESYDMKPLTMEEVFGDLDDPSDGGMPQPVENGFRVPILGGDYSTRSADPFVWNPLQNTTNLSRKRKDMAFKDQYPREPTLPYPLFDPRDQQFHSGDTENCTLSLVTDDALTSLAVRCSSLPGVDGIFDDGSHTPRRCFYDCDDLDMNSNTTASTIDVDFIGTPPRSTSSVFADVDCNSLKATRLSVDVHGFSSPSSADLCSFLEFDSPVFGGHDWQRGRRLDEDT
ncbi:hypothetical protein CPC08DRAFT_754251 [Agrocybe pediades]|nr:hypothetical protein CPC08DRAFT_754251 [Agrocybe pediades]